MIWKFYFHEYLYIVLMLKEQFINAVCDQIQFFLEKSQVFPCIVEACKFMAQHGNTIPV